MPRNREGYPYIEDVRALSNKAKRKCLTSEIVSVAIPTIPRDPPERLPDRREDEQLSMKARSVSGFPGKSDQSCPKGCIDKYGKCRLGCPPIGRTEERPSTASIQGTNLRPRPVESVASEISQRTIREYIQIDQEVGQKLKSDPRDISAALQYAGLIDKALTIDDPKYSCDQLEA